MEDQWSSLSVIQWTGGGKLLGWTLNGVTTSVVMSVALFKRCSQLSNHQRIRFSLTVGVQPMKWCKGGGSTGAHII